MTVTTIHGYYRFTDIFFEWHKVLPDQADVSPLKAMLHYDALVHPEHPFRKQGQDGLELFVGTFSNGEARILFSSAQVEYLRYYLHVMGLTKEPIPLPSSDYLIQLSDMTTCAPVIYSDAKVLKRSYRDLDKMNRKLKGSTPLLTSKRLAFERVRAYWTAKKSTWFAIDFEEWERDHKVLLEFGYSIVQWEDGQEVEEKGHWIVQENRPFRNGVYSVDNQQRYNFGKSKFVSKQEVKDNIHEMIKRYLGQGPLFLVFHDAYGDIKTLKSKAINAPLVNLSHVLPETVPTEGLFVIDTTDMYSALEGDVGGNKRSLETMARHLKLAPENLHNAGNDAHYTMLALRSMASGEQIDAQRERRWPNQTAATEPKVVHSPYSDDEDDYNEGMPNSSNTFSYGDGNLPAV